MDSKLDLRVVAGGYHASEANRMDALALLKSRALKIETQREAGALYAGGIGPLP